MSKKSKLYFNILKCKDCGQLTHENQYTDDCKSCGGELVKSNESDCEEFINTLPDKIKFFKCRNNAWSVTAPCVMFGFIVLNPDEKYIAAYTEITKGSGNTIRKKSFNTLLEAKTFFKKQLLKECNRL